MLPTTFMVYVWCVCFIVHVRVVRLSDMLCCVCTVGEIKVGVSILICVCWRL